MTDVILPDDAFDPSTPDLQSETMPLDEIIRQAIASAQQGLRVAMPCRVTQIRGNQTVDLQPLLQARYFAGKSAVNLPIIPSALVCMPMGGAYSIKLPIAVGDTGLAVFCDRSIDQWAISDGAAPIDPDDSRAHALMDAVFFPGMVPYQAQTQDTTSDLVVTNGQSIARFEAAGRFSFGNGSIELLGLIDNLVQNQVALLNALQTQTFTMTMLGPQPFLASTVAVLAQLQATAQQIKTQLETIKG